MFCRICGKQLPDNSAFCFNCGHAQAPQSPQQAPPSASLTPSSQNTTAEPATPIQEISPLPDSVPFVPSTSIPNVSATASEPQPSYAPTAPFNPASQSAPPQFVSGVTTQKQKPIRKKNAPALIFAIISVLLAAALVLSFLQILPSPFGTSAAGASVASKSFATPEEAIESFVGYLKAGDYDGALSTCAIDNMSRKFDYQKFSERLMVVTALQVSNMPSEYRQYVKYNAYKLSSNLMMQMICFSISFNLSEENNSLIEGMTMPLENGEFPSGLIDELDPTQISSLEIIEISKTSMHDSETNRENQQKQAAMFGAEDIQFRSVLYKYDGNYYVGGFTLIAYDGRWQVQNMSDPIIGIPVFGTPFPVSSESEFQDLLG